MKVEKLIAMANQIAGFFHAYPAAEAEAGVKHHIASFWTPAMRATLGEQLARDVSGLDALVVTALRTPAGGSPIDRVISPAKAGQLATDAG